MIFNLSIKTLGRRRDVALLKAPEERGCRLYGILIGVPPHNEPAARRVDDHFILWARTFRSNSGRMPYCAHRGGGRRCCCLRKSQGALKERRVRRLDVDKTVLGLSGRHLLGLLEVGDGEITEHGARKRGAKA